MGGLGDIPDTNQHQPDYGFYSVKEYLNEQGVYVEAEDWSGLKVIANKARKQCSLANITPLTLVIPRGGDSFRLTKFPSFILQDLVQDVAKKELKTLDKEILQMENRIKELTERKVQVSRIAVKIREAPKGDPS